MPLLAYIRQNLKANITPDPQLLSHPIRSVAMNCFVMDHEVPGVHGLVADLTRDLVKLVFGSMLCMQVPFEGRYKHLFTAKVAFVLYSMHVLLVEAQLELEHNYKANVTRNLLAYNLHLLGA